jgi:cell division septation protein DedD
MRRDVIRAVAALVALLLWSTELRAQETDTTARVPADTVIQRARQLVADGRVADGRRLIDSVLSITPPDSALYAEALYWRAALATTAADAERDYRRLLIEAPLSVQAEDALLQLAQLEQARGDRRSATEHLQRFMLSYANNPARPRVAVALVRLLFEQGQVARGCEALRTGREMIPADNLELKNQLEFYAPRCAIAEVAPAPVTEAPPPTPTARGQPPASTRDSTPRRAPTSRPAAVTASTTKSESAFYSVQVAAYESREAASRMAQTLSSRGIAARVDGTARPFRVRVGRYTTRAEAVKAALALKAQGIGGFVTLVKK